MTFEQFLDAIHFTQKQYEQAVVDADAVAAHKKMTLRERMNVANSRISTNPDNMDEIVMRRYESDIGAVNVELDTAISKAALAREQRLQLIYDILTGDRA